jgi:hypothetical protein
MRQPSAIVPTWTVIFQGLEELRGAVTHVNPARQAIFPAPRPVLAG